MSNQPIQMIVAAATHRSGSTLLQRICNQRKGTLIWGEHGGILNGFVTIFETIRHFSENSVIDRDNYFRNGGDANQWIANMTPEMNFVEKAVVHSVRVLMSELYAPFRSDHDIIGFKEVQYGKEALTLFRKCFPDATILLIVRHPIDAWASAPEWYQDISHFTGKWNANASFFREFADRDPQVHLIKYEDLVQKDKRTLELLSQTVHVTFEEIERTLAVRLGERTNKVMADDDIKFIQEACKTVMNQYGY